MEETIVYTCRLGLRMFEEGEDFYASLEKGNTMRNAVFISKSRIVEYGKDGLVFIDMGMEV